MELENSVRLSLLYEMAAILHAASYQSMSGSKFSLVSGAEMRDRHRSEVKNELGIYLEICDCGVVVLSVRSSYAVVVREV